MNEKVQSEAKSIESILGNMALAHEVVVNNDFQLTPPSENTFYKHIQDIVHRAFWDHLREQLELTPPKYGHALSLLAEIKEILIGLLLPQHQKQKEAINDGLDMTLIEKQVGHDVFDLTKCTEFVISIMLQLCAPYRDDEIKALLRVKDMVLLLRGIMKALDGMKLDMANFRLQSLKPIIVQNHGEYERSQFKQFLEANPNGLEITKKWLKKAFDTLSGLHPSAYKDSKQPSSAVVLTHAYLSFLTWSDDDAYPETLVMDETRLMELSYMFDQLVIVSAVFLITINTIGQHLAADSQYVKLLKKNICIILDGIKSSDESSVMPSVYDQIESDTQKMLEMRHLPAMTETQKESLKGQVINLASPDNSVKSLLKSRMRDYVLLSMTSEKADLGKTVPVALRTVQEEIRSLAIKFSRLVSHNKDVYLPFYESIVDELRGDHTA